MTASHIILAIMGIMGIFSILLENYRNADFGIIWHDKIFLLRDEGWPSPKFRTGVGRCQMLILSFRSTVQYLLDGMSEVLRPDLSDAYFGFPVRCMSDCMSDQYVRHYAGRLDGMSDSQMVCPIVCWMVVGLFGLSIRQCWTFILENRLTCPTPI